MSFMRGLALALLTCVSLHASVPTYPALNTKELAAYDRTWKRLSNRDPNLGARDVFAFLLDGIAHDWRPDHWPAVLALGEELHDADPASATYGNYRWYWREPKPNDRNAVEFSMQSASLAWVAYHDRLPPELQPRFAAALALGAEGMLRQKVDVSYTNIFLMRIANCILIGENIARPDLVARGRAWFDEWLAYTRANGIHEFSSPTYYGTDLTDLGALAKFARDPDVRRKAEAALRLVWTDIAAHWFAPHQGIAGAHSRDYGFLIGHGYLDQALLRAGWIDAAVATESHATIDDLTFWAPPAEIRALANELPRTVVQRWGEKPWERATHYVGRTFSLGSSGAGYGAQDKVLALTFSGGPKTPITSFSLDYRRDPYGQTKMGTADGHAKLTHLLPFVASVQRGPEVLLVASYDPAHSRNPAGGKAPIAYAGIGATFVLPKAVQLFDVHGPVADTGTIPFDNGAPLFVRQGDTAAALVFVTTRADRGQPARIELVRDGDAAGAQRLTAVLAEATPVAPVAAVVWVRAAENITTDEAFALFCEQFLAAVKRTKHTTAAKIEVLVPGRTGELQIVADPLREQRLVLEGGDPDAGILGVNGIDVGGPLLRVN
jgi:hypothetical protein